MKKIIAIIAFILFLVFSFASSIIGQTLDETAIESSMKLEPSKNLEAPSTAGTVSNSDDYYFENVSVIIKGRCRTIASIGDWITGLFIGKQKYSYVQACGTPLERLDIDVYEKSKSGPCLSLKRLKNALVVLKNATGIFFWGSRKQLSLNPIPPIIFVHCHAEIAYIETYSNNLR